MFGVMGKMAQSVVDGGGKITGVVPRFFTGKVRNLNALLASLLLDDKNPCIGVLVTEYVDYEASTEEIVVPDMHSRKKLFFEQVRNALQQDIEYVRALALFLGTRICGAARGHRYHGGAGGDDDVEATGSTRQACGSV